MIRYDVTIKSANGTADSDYGIYLYGKTNRMNFTSILASLRVLAVLEGISYLLFALTMPLKYLAAMPTPNKIVGMAHGFLFIAYIMMVFVASRKHKWTAKTQLFAYLASILPFGTFIADARIFKPTQAQADSEVPAPEK